MLCRVEGSVWSTRKNARLEALRLLLCQPVALDGRSPAGASFVAVDRVDAGEGDLVLVNGEGGSARQLLADPDVPLKSVVVAVVDAIELEGQP